MLSKNLEVFSKSIGLRITETSAFGIYKKYFINIKEEKNKRVVLINALFDDTDENSLRNLELGDSIKDNIDKFEIKDYEISDNALSLSTVAPLPVFREMLDTIVELLEDKEIPNSDFCTQCGTKFLSNSKKKVVSIDPEKYLVCDSCALEMVEDSNQVIAQKEEEVKNSKVFPGILGSIAGGLIGFIIYSLLYFIMPSGSSLDFLKYILCIFGFIIGFLVFYGFKLLGKNFSTSGIVITITATVIFSLLSSLSASVIIFIKELGMNFTNFKIAAFSFIKMQFTNSVLLKFFAISSVIALCFSAVALLIFFSIEFKNKKESKKTAVTVQTLK